MSENEHEINMGLPSGFYGTVLVWFACAVAVKTASTAAFFGMMAFGIELVFFGELFAIVPFINIIAVVNYQAQALSWAESMGLQPGVETAILFLIAMFYYAVTMFAEYIIIYKLLTAD